MADSSGQEMRPDDPFAVLGVPVQASADELRAARRRLAKDLHPDHAGGDAEAMRRLNVAFEEAMSARGASVIRPGRDPGRRGDQSRDQDEGVGRRRVAHDVASFTIEALPAEAFEALLVVTSWIGEVVVDDPPYLLDTRLDEPVACWCRLDLVPDAGASTVSVTIANDAGESLPDIDAVRDVWVACLNRVGRPD